MAFQIQEGSLQRTCKINEENLDLASPNLPKPPQSYSENEICKFAKCRCLRHIINNLPECFIGDKQKLSAKIVNNF